MSAQPRFHYYMSDGSPRMQTMLEDCPLARVYGWRPPIQDWNPRTEPLGNAPFKVIKVETHTVVPQRSSVVWRYGEEKWAEFFRRYDELKAHYLARGFQRMGGKAVKKLCAELDINHGSARTAITARNNKRKVDGVA